jgi:hypothetical protein
VLAFDGSGDIRWYRELSLQAGEDALEGKQQQNGNFSVFLGATQRWQPTDGRYVEFKPGGDVVQSHVASAPYYTDYDLRRADLTSIGGSSDVLRASSSRHFARTRLGAERGKDRSRASSVSSDAWTGVP